MSQEQYPEYTAILVFARNISEYHHYTHGFPTPLNGSPYFFCYMSSKISMYGHKDCSYVILEGWNGALNETKEYLKSHNIQPYVQ